MHASVSECWRSTPSTMTVLEDLKFLMFFFFYPVHISTRISMKTYVYIVKVSRYNMI